MKTENIDKLKLEAYLQEQEPGTLITYESTEHDTGVAMDMDGKALMRAAFKNVKREYVIQRNVGWWLDCVKNASGIVEGKTQRAFRSFVRVKQTIEVIYPRYYHLLPEQERQLLDLRKVVTEAVLGQSRQIPAFYPKRKQLPPQTAENIPLP